MRFRESDGKFLWQAVTDKLASGPESYFPEQGVWPFSLVVEL